MNDTSPPIGSNSSPSAALQKSLANRLQANLAERGSPIYALNWKEWGMQSGPPICALRASAPRISANVSILALCGWPTPTTRDHKDGAAPSVVNTTRTDKLPHAVQLAGWPTPQAGAAAAGKNSAAGNTDFSRRTEALCGKQVVGHNLTLSGWHTPIARDGDKLDATPAAIERREKKGREIGLAMQARMTSRSGWSQWPELQNITGPARITADGFLLTGSTAAMESGGQLSPTHSRWLMGYPPAWDVCADMAMPLSRKSARRS